MAFITAPELMTRLPAGGAGVTDTEASSFISQWRNRLEFAPTSDREKVMAEDLVEQGAHGRLLRLQQLRGGATDTPTANSMLTEAKRMLAEYGNMRFTDVDARERPVAFFGDCPF